MSFRRLLGQPEESAPNGPTTPGPATPGPATPARANNLPFLMIIGALGAAIFISSNLGYDPWNALFINPLINVLVLFNNVLFHNFGVAIIVFTIFMRFVTVPLTIRQVQSTRAMSALQPQIQEVQKKYKDPKRRQEETMKLYKEAGVNPLGCMVPMLIQFPIWIALYRGLIIMVGGTPESLISLSQRLYPWSYLNQSAPLEQHFLWLNLGAADSTFILPILVGASTYVQQKLVSTTPTTPQQQQQQQMMNLMMPLMFVWITLAVPSGLGLYWMVSNVTQIVISYWILGRRAITWRQLLSLNPAPAPAPAVRSSRQRSPAPETTKETIEAEVVQRDPVASGEKRSRDGRRRRSKRKNR